MKKKYIFVFIMLVVLSIGSYTIALVNSNAGDNMDVKTEDTIRVTATFQPVYVAALNIVGDMEHVDLSCMTQQSIGCLHDYQLTVQDMVNLSDADVLIVNGRGMENFLEDVIMQYPEIALIEAGEGIATIEDDADDENSHMWMSLYAYLDYVENIAVDMCEIDPAHEEQYMQNCKLYQEKIQALIDEYDDVLHMELNENVVVFHEAFVYFAAMLDMDVAASVEMDENKVLSAKQVSQIISAIRENDVQMIFAEEQYSLDVGTSVSSETGTKLLLLDPLTFGDMTRDSYLEGMEYNLNTIREVILSEQ